jgi:hypothetical protein
MVGTSRSDRWGDRLVCTSPIIVSAGLGAPFLLYIAAELVDGDGVGVREAAFLRAALTFTTLVSAVLQLCWAWAAYRVACGRDATSGMNGLFVLILAAFCVLGLLQLSTPDLQLAELDVVRNTLALISILGFLACHWVASEALVAREVCTGRKSSFPAVFLLMLYLIIGIWSLRPRVLALR